MVEGRVGERASCLSVYVTGSGMDAKVGLSTTISAGDADIMMQEGREGE